MALYFYGGVIGGFLFALWYCKRYRIYFLEACDLFTPILPFFISLGVLDVFWQGVVMVFRLHGDLYIPMKRLQDYRCR